MIGGKVVAGIVWDREGKRILIARRRPGDEHGGAWEFPGGRVKEGESEEEALVRELEEELGIRVEVIAPLTTVRHEYPGAPIALHAFICRHRNGEPQPIECAAWRWVPLDGLAAERLSPPDRKILPLIEPLEGDL